MKGFRVGYGQFSVLDRSLDGTEVALGLELEETGRLAES